MTSNLNILFYLPFTGTSRRSAMLVLAEELATRGHKITFVTSFPVKNSSENFRQIDIENEDFKEFVHDNAQLYSSMKTESGRFGKVVEMGIHVNELAARDPRIRCLRDEHFDLVFVNPFCNEVAYYFAELSDCPIILYFCAGSTSYVNYVMGNPDNPSCNPVLMTGFPARMTFAQRIANTGLYLLSLGVRRWYMMPKVQRLLESQFPEAGSANVSLTEVESRRASFSFFYSHFAADFARPLMPNSVDVGFMHCRNDGPLPTYLETWLESSGSAGTVLISFGSVMSGSDIPEEKRRAFVAAIGKLPQRFVWKWEDENMDDKPKNLLLLKWLPQQGLLAHPKVKLFVTHGGILSVQESIYYEKPMVGIPIFGDQSSNLKRAESGGYARIVPWAKVNEDTLYNAIVEVLHNSEYTINAKKIGRIVKDSLSTPLKKAVFWTEYVARYNGAPQLRPASLDLAWHQYFLIDVFGLFALFVIILISFFCLIAMFLTSFLPFY